MGEWIGPFLTTLISESKKLSNKTKQKLMTYSISITYSFFVFKDSIIYLDHFDTYHEFMKLK